MPYLSLPLGKRAFSGSKHYYSSFLIELPAGWYFFVAIYAVFLNILLSVLYLSSLRGVPFFSPVSRLL